MFNVKQAKKSPGDTWVHSRTKKSRAALGNPDVTKRGIRIKGLSFGLTALLLISPMAIPVAHSQTTEFSMSLPLGLDEDLKVVPEQNPLTKEKIELGKLLFFDQRLSQDNRIACANCHKPELAFTDGQAVSLGIQNQAGGRSAPTAINRLFSTVNFWDGRASSLEEQSVGPFVNPIEHGFPNHEVMIEKLGKIKGYRILFKRAFGTEEVNIDRVGKAIASFQRTLVSGNSPVDRYDYEADEKALSPAAQRGLDLFRNKARCTKCHSGFNFTDEKFHNLGVDWDGDRVDLGRYHVTKNAEDLGAFKTPTLREISRTAPYMHNGQFATLREVVDFYDQGGIKNPHQDPLILPLDLTEEEKHDLIEMLKALNGEGWQTTAPVQFPQ